MESETMQAEHGRTDGRDDVSVWLVEDQDLYRRTIAELIAITPGLVCAVAASSCEQALDALDLHPPPDIVLMDLGLPGKSGITGIHELRQRHPSTRVIVLTVHEEDDKVFAAICAGASGYLLKTSSTQAILQAIREVEGGAAPINSYIARKVLDRFAELAAPADDAASPGDYGLTAREREILHAMVDGLIMKQIAARLEVSYHTIDTHIRNIYGKLHVRSRGGAVAKALREGLV
jgi:DNA-binding NarL/FixJ family response regulator